jgi:transcriptional regulator with XRE-family HTH domain
MPSIDESAKAWQVELAGRVGKAVQDRRKALGLTAQQLAQRTADFSYPISRVAISKIESNTRAGKVDLGELIVLAAALDTSPVCLIYPGPYRREIENIPGSSATEIAAAEWFSGNSWNAGATGVSGSEGVTAASVWGESTLALRKFRRLSKLRNERMRSLFDARKYRHSGDDDLAQLNEQIAEDRNNMIAELEAELGIADDDA